MQASRAFMWRTHVKNSLVESGFGTLLREISVTSMHKEIAVVAGGLLRAKTALSARADTQMKEHADEPAASARSTKVRAVLGGFRGGDTSAYPDVAMRASSGIGMCGGGVVALPQFIEFVLGESDKGCAPDDAEGRMTPSRIALCIWDSGMFSRRVSSLALSSVRS